MTDQDQQQTFVFLNTGSGSLLQADIDTVATEIHDRLTSAGGRCVVTPVAPDSLSDRIRAARDNPAVTAIIVAGGDGSASSAASILSGTDVALGILPGGTFNLFARSIGMPPDLDEAISALPRLVRQEIDMGRVNDRMFAHHVSFGIHPTLIKERESKQYNSRLGKMFASLHSFISAFAKPKRLRVRIRSSSGEVRYSTAAVLVSNNIIGDGHLPFAHNPDKGTLAAYVSTARPGVELSGAALGTMRGQWNENPYLDRHVSDVFQMAFRRKSVEASIDGELVRLESPVRLESLSKSLTVLTVPQNQDEPSGK